MVLKPNGHNSNSIFLNKYLAAIISSWIATCPKALLPVTNQPTRVPYNNSPSSSDYLSDNEDFPPPAPSPPSIPNTPDEEDMMTAPSTPTHMMTGPSPPTHMMTGHSQESILTPTQPSDSLVRTSTTFQRTPDKRQSSRTPASLQCSPSKRSSYNVLKVDRVYRVDVGNLTVASGDDYLPLPMDLEGNTTVSCNVSCLMF